MAEFPYSPQSARIRPFFEKLQSVGKPTKVVQKWIEGIGFKSKNDRSLLPILKSLKFVDSSGVPTERWSQFRHKENSKSVMAAAIKDTYAILYETYPDAHRKDDEALRNFFSSKTDVGEGALAYMVRTFKVLAEFADFESVQTEFEERNAVPLAPPISEKHQQIQIPSKSPLTINVNIQLQLPATDDAGIYDKLFEALKKHILT